MAAAEFTSKSLDEDYTETAVNKNTGTRHVVRNDHSYKTVCGMYTNWCRHEEEPWPLEVSSLRDPEMCKQCRKTILSEEDVHER